MFSLRFTDNSVPRAQTQPTSCWSAQLFNWWGSAPRNRLAGAGSKPPSAAVGKSHGRERGRKRPGITGSGDRQEEDRKGTTDEVSKV